MATKSRNLAQAYTPEQYAQLAKMYAAAPEDSSMGERDLEELFNRQTPPIYSVGQGVAEAGSKIAESYLRKQAREKAAKQQAGDYKALAEAYTGAGAPMSIANANQANGYQPVAQDQSSMAGQVFSPPQEQSQGQAPDNMQMAALLQHVPDRLKMQAIPMIQGEMARVKAASQPQMLPKMGPGDQLPQKNPDGSISAAFSVPNAPPKSKLLTPEEEAQEIKLRREGQTAPETWNPVQPKEMEAMGYPAGTVGKRSSRGNIDVTYQPKADRAMSTTETKELFEADDAIKAGNMALQSIKRATDLNNKAASGMGADVEQLYNRAFNKEAAADTTSFKAEGLEQALNSLKTTFGGNPTEGERAILLEIQAAPNMTREERSALLTRAEAIANRRLQNATDRKTAITGGEFGRNAAAKAAPQGASGGWSATEVKP